MRQRRARKGWVRSVATAALVAVCPGTWAGKAHEHGVARLDIGVEAARITLNFELALEDLAGFERAPRTDAERVAVQAALARLRNAASLVRIDGAAGCTVARTELVAPLWGEPAGAAAPAAGEAREGHGDLDATYEFKCSAGTRAGHIELQLFEAFARLKRIEVQAVTARGQMKVVLPRPQGRVALAR
jgi:hypothetical protein